MMNRRLLATVAAARSSPSSSTSSSSTIHAGVILKRNPILLRAPTEYELAYHAYRRSVVEPRERFPYRRDFFEAVPGVGAGDKGSSREKEEGDGGSAAKVPAVPYAPRDDGYTVGAADVAEARATTSTSPRHRLDRAMTRPLYLLVKSSVKSSSGTRNSDNHHSWHFPHAPVAENETLRQAAERLLVQHGGGDDNMSVWFVGNAPVAHVQSRDDAISNATSNASSSKATTLLPSTPPTFFMKAQIFSGQLHLKKDAAGVDADLQDFAWVTKEEMADMVDGAYFDAVKDALAE